MSKIQLKLMEKQQDKLFNILMNSIGGVIGGYTLISVGMKFLVHFIEGLISLPFYIANHTAYIKMDTIAYSWGNALDKIGIVVSIICLINTFFVGIKYFNLSKSIKEIKKAS